MVWRGAGTFLRIALALVSVPLYIHFIGVSQWGLLMLFQAAAAPMALLDLGVGPAAIKRVSEALGRGEQAAASRTAQTALLFTTCVLACGSALLLLLGGWFARSVFAIPEVDLGMAVVGFRFVALSWAASAALTFFSNLLVAHQRYDEVLRTSTVSIVAATGGGLAAAALTRDATWVLLAQAIGTSAAAAFAYARASAVLPGLRRRPSLDVAELRGLLSFGAWQTMANVGVLLANWSDRYILGAYFAPRAVGFYSLAQLLQQQLHAVFSEGSDVLFPAISHRQGMGDVAAARRLSLLAGWALTTAFGAAAVSLGVLGGDFLWLWVSPEAASEATPVLRLLCATGVAGLAAVAPVTYAMGTGRSYWQAPFSAVVGVASVITGIALVPTMGLRGVGIGLLAGAVARWGLLALLWRALFREDVTWRDFAVQVWAPPLASLVLLTGLLHLHDAVPHVPGWPGLLAETAIIVPTIALLQIGLGELTPGGRSRRRDVVASFRPVLERGLALLRSH